MIFIVTFVNNSAHFLIAADDKNTLPQYHTENKQKRKFLTKIINRVDTYLKIRRHKRLYLIWMILDFAVGLFMLFHVSLYGFGSENFISRMKQLNWTSDPFLFYRYSRTMNKVSALLVIEIYSIRLRNISYNIAKKDLTAETATYLTSLNLSLRAWLYILGLTDVVHRRDRLHYKKTQCSVHLDISESKVLEKRSNVCVVSYEKTGRLAHRHRFDPVKIVANAHPSISFSNDTEEKNSDITTTEELFNFDADFREINYQFEFPKELLDTGNPHKMNLATLRQLSYINIFVTLFIVADGFIFTRASLMIELNNCQNSITVFLNQRLYAYCLMFSAIFANVVGSVNLCKLIMDCLTCRIRAKNTVTFASDMVDLYWNERKQRSLDIISIIRKRKHDSSNEPFATTFVNNNSKQDSLLVDTMIETSRKNSDDSYKKIDKLIKMIRELRANLDQLKSNYAFCLHMELIFRMPCVMLTIAEVMKLKDLDTLQLQVVYCMFTGYCIPIAIVGYAAALIHAQVST